MCAHRGKTPCGCGFCRPRGDLRGKMRPNPGECRGEHTEFFMAKYEQRCSFCGKEKSKVKKLIAGPDGVFICDECVELCRDMMAKMPSNAEQEQVELKKPAEIKAELDPYIIG